MLERNKHISDVLPRVVHGAVTQVLSDAALSEKVSNAVLAALDAYEDEKFLALLQETDDGGDTPLSDVLSALKS